MTSPRAVCVGEGLVVMVAEPGPLENSGRFTRGAGGAEANVARVLARLGVATAWASRVGDDGFGRYLRSDLVEAGVDTSAVLVDPTRSTGLYVKERGAGTAHPYDLALGESRMAYFRSGSAASALCADDVDWIAGRLAPADLVHVSGITLALSDSARAAVARIGTLGATVSFDLNHRPTLWNSGVEAARVLGEQVRRSDVVLMGADEAEVVFGTGDPAALRALFPEPRRLVIKNDSAAVTAYDGEDAVVIPAVRVEVVEKIGAGDAFAGGYLAGVLHGVGTATAVRWGHLCAAAALTAHGDGAAVPTVADLTAAADVTDDEWSKLAWVDVAGAVAS